MSFTFTDRNAKTVLHSWGRFRGAVEEAVVVGDLLAIKEDADSGFQLANVTNTQTAVAVACQDGEADQTIWMAMIAELKAPTTIATGGVATQTYFAASGDTMGSAVYLSTTDGKLSSSQGAVVQLCGYILARDRVLVVPTTYLSATSLAISGALSVGDTLAVTSTTSLGDNVTMTSGKYIYLRGTTAYVVSDASTDLMVNAPTNLMLAIGGTDEVHLTASALSPATSNGNALGTTSLMWADLFLANGGVINWNNGATTITWNGSRLIITGSTLKGGGGMVQWGEAGDGLNQEWATDTNGDYMWFYPGAKELQFLDTHIRLLRNAELRLGNDDSSDAVIKYDGTYLTVTGAGLSGSSNQIFWGSDGTGINQTWFTDTGGDYMCFLATAATKELEFYDTHIRLLDNAELRLGSAEGGDGVIKYDGTYLTITGDGLTGSGNAIFWGSDGVGINQTWFTDTSGDYMWFDAGSKIFGFVDVYFVLSAFASGLAHTGCLWLDTTDDKLHFYDGSAERVVTDDR